MRLIDADEIMKALSIFNDSKNGNVHFLYGIRTAKELIDDAPTVGGWISVKEGLPSHNRVYLITLKTPEGLPQVMEAYLDCDGTWWRGNVSLINEYVTHWMPLPQAPKEITRDENC